MTAAETTQIMEEAQRLEPLCGVATSKESRAVLARLRKQTPFSLETRLGLYAAGDHSNLLRLVLLAGCSPDAGRWGENQRPPLSVAAREGAARSLQVLLEGGADMKLTDNGGRTALHYAAGNNREMTTRLLCAAGAPLEAKENSCYTPLLLAASFGYTNVCAVLLEAGANLRAVNAKGATALHVASNCGHPAVINLLIGAGADIEALAECGHTPLCAAAVGGKIGAIGRLLARGANPGVRNVFGNTPLLLAASQPHPLAVRALLPVSDLGVINLQGKNVLHMSMGCASDELFNAVLPFVTDLEAGTLVDATIPPEQANFPTLNTALHLGCYFGESGRVQALVRRGASLTAVNSLGHTPLCAASEGGALRSLVAVLGLPGSFRMTPAEVNIAAANGCTALHPASARGDSRACGLLIQAGARLDAMNVNGETPLIVAQQRHPDKSQLHTLLSGNWAGPLPGTFCDRCHAVPDSQLMHCSGCLSVRYCCPRCATADWPSHAAFCKERRAVRKRWREAWA